MEYYTFLEKEKQVFKAVITISHVRGTHGHNLPNTKN
jgi:hypothetical protein